MAKLRRPMRIFVTGSTGFIGSAVAEAFRFEGHHVYGMVRSETQCRQLERKQIIPVLTNGLQGEVLRDTLNATEVWVHCAYEYSKEGIERDAQFIECFLKAAESPRFPKTLIYTSGVWMYGDTQGKIVDETSELNCVPSKKWRITHEERILNTMPSHVKTVIMRPGCVYGGSGSLTSDCDSLINQIRILFL